MGNTILKFFMFNKINIIRRICTIGDIDKLNNNQNITINNSDINIVKNRNSIDNSSLINSSYNKLDLELIKKRSTSLELKKPKSKQENFIL